MLRYVVCERVVRVRGWFGLPRPYKLLPKAVEERW